MKPIRALIFYFGIGYIFGAIGFGRIFANTVDAEAMKILKDLFGDSADLAKSLTSTMDKLTYVFDFYSEQLSSSLKVPPIWAFGLSFGLISGLLSKK